MGDDDGYWFESTVPIFDLEACYVRPTQDFYDWLSWRAVDYAIENDLFVPIA